MDSNNLYHHGVKGMKWGVRKKRNENYSDKQRKQDVALYGKGAERRINKKMNKGYGIQGARHFEVERRDKRDRRKKTVKKVVSNKYVRAALLTAGGLALGQAGAQFAKNPKVQNVMYKAMSKVDKEKVSKVAEEFSGIYSKTLGREMTLAEAIAKGFM